jgi:two-component system chemotaxis response regulator CheY
MLDKSKRRSPSPGSAACFVTSRGSLMGPRQSQKKVSIMAKTVVIVDDSQYVINLLVEFFTKTMHFSVVATGVNGDDALTLFREHKPDLLTLDIVMPHKDGIMVVDELIAEFPLTKILIISAIRGETLMKCVEKGASDFINKPLTMNDPAFVMEFESVVNRLVG